MSATISANSANTVNFLIKEAMANMPDTFNTKKEIDEYYKKVMKDLSEKMKEDKKVLKEVKKQEAKDAKSVPKKRTKKVKELDEDGNEIVKAKKPLNNYQKFIQDQRPKVKEEYPELSGEEIFTKIAELWKIHKENMKSEDDKKSDTEDEKKSDDDDVIVAKPEKKEKKAKVDKV
jgi:hypothetical protein